MSAFNSGSQDFYDKVNLFGPTPEELGSETTYKENFEASLANFKYEWMSNSEEGIIGDPIKEQLNKLKTLKNPDYDPNNISDFDLSNDRLLSNFKNEKQEYRDKTFEILELQKKHPELGLLTYDQMMVSVQSEAQKIRENMEQVTGNRTWGGVGGEIAGMAVGAIQDPIILASMFLGTGKITGGTKAANALKAFFTEAGIAMGAEVMIQPNVINWKARLDSPYSLKEAAITVLTVGGFAGVVRAGGSVTVDVIEAASAARKLRAQGKTTEADILDSFVDMYASGRAGPGEFLESQYKPMEVIQKALDEGRLPGDSDIEGLVPRGDIQQLNPNDIQVDAATFQFKADGDAQGVSDALKGVKDWDPIAANTVIVWERADGVKFIADGHQRLGLAKRLAAEGADDISMNAFVLRESDGFTPQMVREQAALINIAQGTGSAIDAAKILRDAGPEGRSIIDNLPPNQALVMQGRGLSKLDDESFRLMIDKTIPERFGALVGDLIEGGANQAAAIRALAKAKPANLIQARSMISDMNAAGFTKVKTDDLFGGVEFSESLIVERAKVIDNAVNRLKKDKAVFKTLTDQENRISGGGNVLDRAKNLQRLSSDENSLATLTALANNKGPVSDAINEAAAKLKAGESLQNSTKGIVKAVKQAIKDGGIEPEVITKPEIGKPVKLQDLNDKSIAKAESEFRSKQLKANLSVAEYHKKAKPLQKQFEKIGKEIAKDLGDDGLFLSPGIKELKKVKNKVKDKYRGKTGRLTDVIRMGFALKNYSDTAKIINKISSKYEVLDEGFIMNGAGYFDHKLIVRFKNGQIGEIQMWEPHLLAAKEGKDFVDDLFTEDMKKFISDFDVPSRENSGHNIYDKQKDLLEDGVIPPKNQAEFDRLNKEQDKLYSRASQFSKTSWNTALESFLPDSITSRGETGSQTPGRSGSSIVNAAIDPSGGATTTAGKPSQLYQSTTSSSLNINSTSKPIIPGATERIYLNDPEMAKMIDSEIMEAQRIVDQFGEDFQVPYSKLDGFGEEIVEIEAARKVFNDIDQDEKVVNDLFTCMGGS
jgi:hypothetical protein